MDNRVPGDTPVVVVQPELYPHLAGARGTAVTVLLPDGRHVQGLMLQQPAGAQAVQAGLVTPLADTPGPVPAPAVHPSPPVGAAAGSASAPASRYRGVKAKWLSQEQRTVYEATCHFATGAVYLGRFSSEEVAARAYDRMAIYRNGWACARTNFPVSSYRGEVLTEEQGASLEELVANIKATAEQYPRGRGRRKRQRAEGASAALSLHAACSGPTGRPPFPLQRRRSRGMSFPMERRTWTGSNSSSQPLQR